MRQAWGWFAVVGLAACDGGQQGPETVDGALCLRTDRASIAFVAPDANQTRRATVVVASCDNGAFDARVSLVGTGFTLAPRVVDTAHASRPADAQVITLAAGERLSLDVTFLGGALGHQALGEIAIEATRPGELGDATVELSGVVGHGEGPGWTDHNGGSAGGSGSDYWDAAYDNGNYGPDGHHPCSGGGCNSPDNGGSGGGGGGPPGPEPDPW